MVVKRPEQEERKKEQPFEDVQQVDDTEELHPMLRSKAKTVPAGTRKKWTPEEVAELEVLESEVSAVPELEVPESEVPAVLVARGSTAIASSLLPGSSPASFSSPGPSPASSSSPGPSPSSSSLPGSSPASSSLPGSSPATSSLPGSSPASSSLPGILAPATSAGSSSAPVSSLGSAPTFRTPVDLGGFLSHPLDVLLPCTTTVPTQTLSSAVPQTPTI
nr:PREDICTED: endochitinase A1-like [Austrofundulus limnaeus]